MATGKQPDNEKKVHAQRGRGEERQQASKQKERERREERREIDGVPCKLQTKKEVSLQQQRN
jgi:hypothetical protein